MNEISSSKLTQAVIGIIVAVIVLGVVLVPVLSQATETENTFDNTEYAFYQMKELESGDGWVRDGNVWTYGGETLTLSSSDNVSVVVTNNTSFRQSGQVRGTTYGGNTTNTVDVVTIDSSDVIKLNTNTTIPYNSGYGAVQSGDYILKTYTDKAYVHGNTNLWVTGVTGLPQTDSRGNLIVHIEGTINDGVTITVNPVSNGLSSNIVVGTPTINYSKVAGYDDLYLIDNIIFDITADYTPNGGETTVKTTTATYSTFVLPKEVTAEVSNHPTSMMITLMNVIPVFIVLAIILGVCGLFYYHRNENSLI